MSDGHEQLVCNVLDVNLLQNRCSYHEIEARVCKLEVIMTVTFQLERKHMNRRTHAATDDPTGNEKLVIAPKHVDQGHDAGVLAERLQHHHLFEDGQGGLGVGKVVVLLNRHRHPGAVFAHTLPALKQ
jgi:hypothetical protein